MSSISKRVFKGALWLVFTRLFVNVLGFASTLLLARMLTPADFGIVAIATSLLAIGLSVTDMSLGAALIQREEILEEHFHSVWTFSVARSAVIFGVVALLAYPISVLYKDPRLAPVILVSGLVAAIPGFASPKIVVFTRSLVFWQQFAIQSSQRIAVFIVAVGVAFAYHSYWALIFGNLVGAVVNVALSYVISPFLPKFGTSKLRELFSFSFWVAMGDTINTLNWKFDQIVLGFLVGKSALGIYSVADNLSSLPVREATSPLRETLFPAFSRIADDAGRLRYAYIRTQNLLCAISFPVGFGFAAVAAPAVTAALGRQWSAAIPIIQILSATFAFQALSSTLEPLAMAKGATKILFGRDVRTFVLRIPFITVGYLIDGLMGVVVARAAASAITTIWNLFLVSGLSGISVKEQIVSCWRIAVSTIIMIITILIVNSAFDSYAFILPPILTLAYDVLAGGSAYVVTMLLLWYGSGRPEGIESELVRFGCKSFYGIQNRKSLHD